MDDSTNDNGVLPTPLWDDPHPHVGAAPRYFVVMERCYEYNDEVFYSTQANAGTPLRVFRRLEEALTLQQILTLNRLRGLDLADYSYDVDDLLANAELRALATVFGWGFSADPNLRRQLVVPEYATDDQLRALDDALHVDLFYVQEVNG
jgi:hypothetical protein